jgi:hypothetical protein
MDVLGKLALDDVLQVNDVDRDGSPAQQFDGLQASAAGDQPSLRRDHDRVQEADFLDGLGQRPKVTQGLAESAAHLDVFERPLLGHGSYPWGGISLRKTWPQEVVAASRSDGDGFPYRPRSNPAGGAFLKWALSTVLTWGWEQADRELFIAEMSGQVVYCRCDFQNPGSPLMRF